ncbi:MAG: hypothetical protein AAFU64_00785 [Bacteroidota bacterium]
MTFWTNSMFGGMPTFMIYLRYPGSITSTIAYYITHFIPDPATFVFLYLAGFYIAMVMLGYSMWSSIFGAIAYAFASYNMISIEAGHVSKVFALALAPPFIASVVLTYRGKWLLGSALAGFCGALELYGNHVQITYYVLIAMLTYAIYVLIKIVLNKKDQAKQLRVFVLGSACLVLFGVLAVGSHASRLWLAYEYSKQTIRGGSELTGNPQSSKTGLDRDYAFNWSYGIGESFTFLIPNFYAGGSGIGAQLDENSNSYKVFVNNNLDPRQIAGLPFYMGDMPFTSGPAYMGAIVLFFFVFALFLSKDSLKWWLLGVTIFLIMLSWGKHFPALNYFFFDYVPLYNKFRAITMLVSVAQIFVAWMGVLGLEALLDKATQKDAIRKSLYYSAGITAGLCLFFAVLGSTVQNYRSTAIQEYTDAEGNVIRKNQDDAYLDNLKASFKDNPVIPNSILRAIEDDRADMQKADAWRSFIFIALAAGVVFLSLLQSIPWMYAIMGISFLSLIDLWAVDRRYFDEDNFARPSDAQVAFDKSAADRTILADKDLHFRVFNTTRGLVSDATTSYHHRTIGGYHGAKLRRFQDILDRHLTQRNINVYNMLNTKYFIAPGQGDLQAQLNPGALGNAWFVDEFVMVKNADAEIDSLTSFDPKKTAFVDVRFEDQVKDLKIKKDPQASISLISYKPNELVYESKSASEQLAIFSEIYYVNPNRSEWKAYIDGAEVPHFRANYILRALVIPAGEHRIEFKFDSRVYKDGETVALICSLLLLLGLGYASYREMKEEDEVA